MMTNNPFRYSDEEAKNISERLNLKLGPEFVSTRSGPAGSTINYISGNKAIELANRILGFNGWSTQIISFTEDFYDNSNGKHSTCITCIMRVILKDGTFREDVGCGTASNARTKAEAFEKAKKEAVTDAMKRCLRTFGSALGNCLYDRFYLRQISKIPHENSEIKLESLIRESTDFSKQVTAPLQTTALEQPIEVVEKEAKSPIIADGNVLLRADTICEGVVDMTFEDAEMDSILEGDLFYRATTELKSVSSNNPLGKSSVSNEKRIIKCIYGAENNGKLNAITENPQQSKSISGVPNNNQAIRNSSLKRNNPNMAYTPYPVQNKDM